MHNLGIVLSFEFFRTVKKRAFWLSILIFPVITAIIFGITYASNKSADTSSQNALRQRFSIAVLDDSGLVSSDVLQRAGVETAFYKQAGIEKVRNGTVDAFFYYPPNPSSQNVEIYAKDAGLSDNGKYAAVAKQLLQSSVIEGLGTGNKAGIVQGSIPTALTTYKDGQETAGIERVILPGSLLVLFYLVIILLGNQMLSSTTEEKENRVIEMILTTVSSQTLILGKILALILIGAVQVVVTVLPTLIAFLFFRDRLNLPNVDLRHLHADPLQMGIGIVVFIASFLLFTGLLVAIGAAVPTAKEANRFFGIAMFSMFVPFYAIGAIVTSPDQAIVRFFTFFPLTAPITLMLRNTVGNLNKGEAAAGIAILIVFSLLSLRVAIHAFQYGTLEYSRRLRLREIFGR